jgi:oxygen-independent coproporphyrinogen-3 oxidase
MAGIYIHIPFCKQACYYCDFHFSTNQEKKAEMVQAINTELSLQKNYLESEPVQTIYFGGGTPSLLTREELEAILNGIYTHFQVAEMPEITLEANPDDLSTAKFRALRESGVNRLSIGIQSFDDTVLQFLNRAHDAASSYRCVEEARNNGFDNISIDLIYSIPGQDDATWLKNIQKALALHPEHISSYSLTIEEKTAFGRWAAQGKLKGVEDEISAGQLELLVESLEQAGYEQYEVSNFARPGFISRHNSSYWREQKYLGVGPSAHSFNGISRQYNIPQNHTYLQSLAAGKLPSTVEMLSREDKINDYLLTRLRTSWGADLKKLKEELAYDLFSIHRQYLDSLRLQGFAYIENDVLVLSRTGKLLADKISSDLFAVA